VRKRKKAPKFVEVKDHTGRIYAFGDIHGCFREFDLLLSHLIKKKDLVEEDILLFIGDYVDRGPASKEVIERLINLESETRAKVICLKGNHEDMMLSFLGFEGTLGQGYLLNGGMETLASYGVKALLPPEELVAELPDAHLAFLRGLERYAIIDDFVFAHAGLNPLRDLRFQLNDDLFWIRDEFIANMHYFEKTVVFGHTPFEDVLFHLPYKIGIDTGLVYGSALTCVEVRDEQVFQIELKEKKIREYSFADKGAEWPQFSSRRQQQKRKKKDDEATLAEAAAEEDHTDEIPKTS
jgi:serine/threonine protein phosphatase 1